MLTRTEILKKLAEKKNCAQITLGEFAEDLGFDVEETDRIAGVFGGGMRRGNVCGAATGAYMAIGAFAKDDDEAHELAAKFDEKFLAKHGTLLCKELLGVDFSIPGEKDKAAEAGLMTEKCPGFIGSAIEILEEILQ